jgi:predicted RNase H-like HicB family nuclease
MQKRTYFGVFEPTGTGGYSVYFPDVPGCISAGDDLDHALEMAKEALGLHLYALEKGGEEPPVSTQMVAVEPETQPGWLVCPVTIYPDMVRNTLDNRAVKTNVTIPAWLKELAESRSVNYSKVFQSALMDYLGLG